MLECAFWGGQRKGVPLKAGGTEDEANLLLCGSIVAVDGHAVASSSQELPNSLK